jgi:ABC-type uncharacterized transport system permease subunit
MAAGAFGGAAMSLVLLVLNTWLGLNQIVLGIAISLAGSGITSVPRQDELGPQHPRRRPEAIVAGRRGRQCHEDPVPGRTARRRVGGVYGR